MSNLYNKSDKEIKAWLVENKVLFVTNTRAVPGTLYMASMKTYFDNIPIHNFWIIPGEKDGKPFYGVAAYIYMMQFVLQHKYFDYVIYIDEDCFINDFNALIEEFNEFKESSCCIAGPQDGGVFCHRNHSKLMINTFLSFWNIKLIKEKGVTTKSFMNYIASHVNNLETTFEDFYADMIINHKELLEVMENSSNIMINNAATYRFQRFPQEGLKYLDLVKNDPNNIIEPHQIPYSYKDKEEKLNFEPYYIIEQALVTLTDTPIYYLFATDYYDERDSNVDNSGLSSMVMSKKVVNAEFNDHHLIAVHSWFSRAYTKWPHEQIELDHTKRINTLIKKFSKI